MTQRSTEKKKKKMKRRRKTRLEPNDTTSAAAKGANSTTASGVFPSAPSTNAFVCMSNSMPSNAPCYFLGLPLEIRLNIYRILLLDPSSTFLESTIWQDIHNAGESAHEYNIAGGEKTSVYGTSDYEGSPRLETCLIQLEGHVRSKQLCSRAHAPQRTPAILQTNRQIHTEASSVLYPELQLVVKPEDALIRRSSSSVMIASRNAPSYYPDCRRRDSGWIGTIRPHIFTRFQKVRYEAGFDLWQDMASPELRISDDFQISTEDETRLVTYFKDATARDIPALYLIQEFVDMLLKSPLINILEVALSVKVPPDHSSLDFRRDGQLGPVGSAKVEAVDSRAYELFLESGVLEPLKKLTNVKRFTFDFALVNYLPQRKLFQPKQKHLDIIDDLKTSIERNWIVKPAYPWQQWREKKKDKKKRARLSVSALGGHASGG